MDVSILLQAMPYIRAFREKLFVVKLGGELLKDPEHLDAIAKDLTLVHMVGIKVIVVHGGGPQANALSESLGFKPQMVGGRRVTDAAALEVAKMVFAGKINTEMLSALSRHGSKGVGVSGVDAGIIKARKRPPTTVTENGEAREIDFGFVGDVEEVDTTLLRHLIDHRYIPVVGSLAADAEGTILNINADTIASEIAADLKAEKLIGMTSVSGVYRDAADAETVISKVTADGARNLIAQGVAGKGMIPKLQACIRAVERGVREAHIINGFTPYSLLLEIFTDDGVGTMVVPNEPAPAPTP